MNQKLYLLIILLLGSIHYGKSLDQNNKYPVSDIDADLKRDAHAIIRHSKSEFHVESINSALYKRHIVITVLNKKGDDEAIFICHYDKLNKLKSYRIQIYNAQGKLIKKVKNSDIKDVSATTYGNLFDDNRLKYYYPMQNTYPYTIEYEYELHYNGILNYPSSLFIPDYRIAVENSIYSITIPKNMEFRYKTYNFSGDFQQTTEKNREIYTWSISNHKALKKEPFSPALSLFTPRVVAGPINFQVEQYKGNQDTWKELGKWIASINEGRHKLAETTVKKIEDLTSNCKTTKDKIQKIYQHLQSNTRYVSIQLGIGGIQPFPASTVDEVGYGDCKALSLYMKSMLQAIGIPSFYTLVNAGRNTAFDTTFVRDNFNHVILMVPIENDTIWLECTNQRQPFGFLGSFTCDRDVLVITDKGGKLIHTPVYTQNQNTQNQSVQVKIDTLGNAIVRSETNYQGLQYENLEEIYNAAPEDQKRYFYNNLKISNFNIIDLKLNQIKEPLPKSQLKLEFQINKYASKTGERLFIPLNILNRRTYIPKKLKKRTTDIKLNTPFWDQDSVTYTLPESYTIENHYSPVKIVSDFGIYTSHITIKDQKITYVRKLKIYKGLFKPSQYEQLRDFYKDIVRADNARIVLKKRS